LVLRGSYRLLLNSAVRGCDHEVVAVEDERKILSIEVTDLGGIAATDDLDFGLRERGVQDPGGPIHVTADEIAAVQAILDVVGVLQGRHGGNDLD
jgi:hypothetical protein